jgi:hypothetical protein
MLGLRSDCSVITEVERNPAYIEVEWDRPCPVGFRRSEIARGEIDRERECPCDEDGPDAASGEKLRARAR